MRAGTKQLLEHFTTYNKVLILLGARQVGKTTLLRKIFPDALYYSVDNEPVRKALESYDIDVYRALIGTKRQIILDEIHQINDPGRCAKIIFDHLPDIQLIITGSSSFHIRNKTTESLAGRKIDYYMYPLTIQEYLYQNKTLDTLESGYFQKLFADDFKKLYYHFDTAYFINEFMIYGQYPDILNMPKDIVFLKNLADSVIFKDIMELHLIENRQLATNLLKLLAHQIGSLVNIAELSVSLKADQRTIKRYIEIFEDSYIIFKLYPFTTNKRDEVTKAFKVYFHDTGLRNAVINDFSAIETRSDKGALFENLVIAEYMKCNYYSKSDCELYFWRTKNQSEVDLVMKQGDTITGIEIKYTKSRVNQSFCNHYPEARFISVSVDNFL